MAEPMTTLTDYAIALECLLFAGLLFGLGRAGWLWATVFGCVSIAALLGGTYHGWAPVLSWQHLRLLWQGTVIALALASGLMVVAAAVKTPKPWRLVLLALATGKLSLSLVASPTPQAFAVSVIDYASALGIVLLIQSWYSLRQKPGPHLSRPPSPGTVWMIGGILISGLAAGCLIRPWSETLRLSPLAGYHFVQMVALYYIYRSVKALAQVK